MPVIFNIDASGNYRYTQGNDTWLQGAPLSLYTDGQKHSTEDGSMKLVASYQEVGSDKVGQWRSTCFQYLVGSVRYFDACAKTWVNPQLPVTVFQQVSMMSFSSVLAG